MNIIELISQVMPLQKYIINKNVDIEYEALLAKATNIQDRFIKNFYCQAVSCAKEDIYEFYVGLLQDKFISAESEVKTNSEFVAKLFKWFCVYHAVEFIHNEETVKSEGLITFACDIFNFSGWEKAAIDQFLRLGKESEACFQAEFFRFIIDEVIQTKNTPATLAFVNNFFYNSFQGFIKSFTNYVSLNGEFYTSEKIRA